jgi:hypothetical protein
MVTCIRIVGHLSGRRPENPLHQNWHALITIASKCTLSSLSRGYIVKSSSYLICLINCPYSAKNDLLWRTCDLIWNDSSSVLSPGLIENLLSLIVPVDRTEDNSSLILPFDLDLSSHAYWMVRSSCQASKASSSAVVSESKEAALIR